MTWANSSSDESVPNEIQVTAEGITSTISNRDAAKQSSEYFADQIRSFLSGSEDSLLAGEDTIDSLLFVEECYKKREDLAYPWQTDDVSHFIRPPLLPVKILIVGASGFLGTRLAEILSLDLGLKVAEPTGDLRGQYGWRGFL